jgi:hypothetical protein
MRETNTKREDSEMIKTYSWEKEAIEGIRTHFRNRNAARSRQGKRVVLRKRFADLRPDGDMVYTYTYGGETVTMISGAYNVTVDYGDLR